MTVHSPKTEHHEGKATRVIPLFPELRKCLEEVFDAAAPGTRYVITKYRDSNANLRTQFERIIRRRVWSRGPSCVRTSGRAARRN